MGRVKKSKEPAVKGFQLFDDPEIDSKVNSGSFKTVETKNSGIDKKKDKVSKKDIKNTNGSDRTIGTDSCRRSVRTVGVTADDKQVGKRKSGKNEQRPESAICKSKDAGKKSASAKAVKSKTATDGKRTGKTDKSAKRKNSAAGNQAEIESEQVVPAKSGKEIKSELIEDHKSKNAPAENLIGKICPKTHLPYKQVPCCKKGWTYMDVTDLKWNREHIGYGANDYHSSRFAEDMVEKEQTVTKVKNSRSKKRTSKSERVQRIEKRAKIRAKVRK